MRVRWRKGQSLDPDWKIDTGYVIEVEGRPTIRTTVEILPPPDFEGTTFEEFMVLGMILTAMPAVNAIPNVVAAAPGSSPTPTSRSRCRGAGSPADGRVRPHPHGWAPRAALRHRSRSATMCGWTQPSRRVK
jgi:hypothetical protein